MRTDGRTVTGATEEQARNRFPFGCLFRFWAIRRSCQAATAWLRSRDFGGVVGGKIQQNRRLDRMAVCTAGEIPHSFFLLARGNRELRAAVFGRFSRTQHTMAWRRLTREMEERWTLCTPFSCPRVLAKGFHVASALTSITRPSKVIRCANKTLGLDTGEWNGI